MTKNSFKLDNMKMQAEIFNNYDEVRAKYGLKASLKDLTIKVVEHYYTEETRYVIISDGDSKILYMKIFDSLYASIEISKDYGYEDSEVWLVVMDDNDFEEKGTYNINIYTERKDAESHAEFITNMD